MNERKLQPQIDDAELAVKIRISDLKFLDQVKSQMLIHDFGNWHEMSDFNKRIAEQVPYEL